MRARVTIYSTSLLPCFLDDDYVF